MKLNSDIDNKGLCSNQIFQNNIPYYCIEISIFFFFQELISNPKGIQSLPKKLDFLAVYVVNLQFSRCPDRRVLLYACPLGSFRPNRGFPIKYCMALYLKGS